MKMKPILDLSYWDGPIDWDVLAPLVAAVILRAGYGCQKDERFEEYYAGATRTKIPKIVYQYPIDQRGLNEQLDSFATWIDGKVLDGGIECDVEVPPTNTGHTLSKSMVDGWLAGADRRFNTVAGIYTSKSKWNEIMGDSTAHGHRPLHVANYDVTKPLMPTGWDDWAIWQYTDEGKIAGIEAFVDLNHYNTAEMLKMQSVGITATELKKAIGRLVTTNTTQDLAVRLFPVTGKIQRWLKSGTDIEYMEERNGWYCIGFDEWISGAWAKVTEEYAPFPTTPPIELPPDPNKDYLFEAEVNSSYDYLPVRSGPGMTFPELSQLINGDLVKVYEANKDRWYRIGDGQWIMGSKVQSLTPAPKSLGRPLSGNWPISQIFGVRSSVYAASQGHNGVDWACNAKTPLLAAADGYIETLENTTTYGYGRHVRVRIEGGVLIYGHMLLIDVTLGQKVEKGDVLGISDGAVGMPYAGFSSGNHLHFELRLDRAPDPMGLGNHTYWAIDPLPLIVK
jgi:GH25 family lysozyme M1 (1,4-beta-N-acetylmuramidase)